MEDLRTLELAYGLAQRDGRSAAAAQLARHLGAEGLMLFVRDPELSAFLPAPGLQQVIPGGSGWRDLLGLCEKPGSYTGTVAFPSKASVCAAAALSTGEVALVFLGGQPSVNEPQLLCLPFLASTLKAEIAREAALGRERAAREAARHATTLTAVLDATRAELERLNSELRIADRTKDEFLAMLAHELRNPLSPIVSSIELLRLQDPSGPQPKRILDIMERQARHLMRLVDDLLDVSRISHGHIRLRLEPVAIGTALQQAADGARPLIEREQHVLEMVIPETPIYVMADPLRLTQVLANLLTNAAKYTNPGGRIEVVVRRESNQAVVSVKDSGIGIDKEMLPRIFELFVQAPGALDRARGGLGIGLTLVRRLVALHEGSIEATSEGIGKGSEFVVRLTITEQRPEPRPPRQTAVRTGRRVLLVEDNSDSAEMLAEALRLGGFVVRVASDGEAGVAAAIDFDPEVILLDIGLPKRDGYSVARELRPRLPKTTIIAFSGYGDEAHRVRSREAGFDAHLVKPVELSELIPILASAQR